MSKLIKKTKSVSKAVATAAKAPIVPVETKPSAPAAARPAPAARPNVTLELVHPLARQVCVAGSFNNWQPETTPLAPAGNGRWIGGLSVKPGRHEYLFVVDGQWLPDPNAKERVQNPFGGENSVMLVTE